MLKEYTLNLNLKDEVKEVFATTYRIALWEDFVNNK